MVASARWDALGCDCEVVTVDSADLAEVAEFARGRVQQVEECCSRFGDSELATLPRGRSQRLSPVLSHALDAALRTAEFTNGLVDPTLGTGWKRINFDPASDQVTVPERVQLDLGAIGKAWAADWVAEACVTELGAGVLVNLGAIFPSVAKHLVAVGKSRLWTVIGDPRNIR